MSAETISARLGGEEFPAQVLGRTHRRYPASADQRDAFAYLLTWPALNELIATHRLEPPRLRLSSGGSTVPVEDYTSHQPYRRMPSWNAPVPHLLHEQLRNGATLVVDAIDEMHPPVGEMAAGIEAWLRTPLQVNAYASWTAREGFGVHWDDHDVIIVQVSGRKRWRIYGTTRPAPLYNDVEFDDEEPTDPIDEFTMEPGDVLHVPRGCWHAASASEGEPSLHLTCGLSTTTGVDFLTWLTARLVEHEEIRADVPRRAGDEAAWSERMARLVTERLHSPEVVEEFWRHRDETAPARATFSLPVAVTRELAPSSRVRFASLRGHLHERDGEIVYAAQGRQWRMAARIAPVLHRLSTGESVTTKELHQLVPDVTETALFSALGWLLDGGALVWDGEQ